MSANPAMVVDFSVERMARARRGADARPHLNLGDAQRRLAKCCDWLQRSGIQADGFAFSTLSRPVVFVPAQLPVWQLFAGRVASKGHRQIGALRYEVFEAFDEHNFVAVRWEEVAACA